MNKFRPMAAACAVAALAVIGAGAAGGAPAVVADWQMNEPAGASVMHDETGSHDGAIGPDAAAQGLTTGNVDGGTTYYHWQARCPVCLPVALDRVVKVSDSAELDIPDPTVPYTLEFRYRTTHGYGNIMQKGQSDTTGGQIKVQLPNGQVQCLFKGANGVRVGSGSGTHLFDDGQWHTVRCVHYATSVETWVDGVRYGLKRGSTGPIDNARQFVIGGKTSCDQGRTTCDYYSGDIDWVRISRG